MQIRKWYAYAKYEENLFVIKIVSVYVAWKIVHYFLLHASVISPLWQKIIFRFGSLYCGISSFVLNLAGEDTVHRGISVVYLHNGRYMRAEEHCLAIPAMVVFSCSILFFSGKWSNKLWFIPLGIFAVFIINTIRFAAICYIFEHFSAAYFELHHSFIYVVITYGLIMLMLIWWMQKFSDNSI